jgi:hypothetical protein
MRDECGNLLFLLKVCATLMASMPFFKQHPCCLTYFFATAKRSKQERPRSSQFFNHQQIWLLTIISGK